RVLAGEGAAMPLRQLADIGRLENADEQRNTFDAAVRDLAQRSPRRRTVPSTSTPVKTLPVRRVVYFNPDMFITQRTKAAKDLEELNTWVVALGDRAHANPKRYSPARLRAQVDRELARRALLDAFDVEVT